ncbi:hypothetical protein EV128_12217 [Rhizobium azibense]|nr:hypothetical protein EV128_12217 [Rhizobium azibense]
MNYRARAIQINFEDLPASYAPNYLHLTVYMTLGLAGALTVMAFRLGQYLEYLATVPV